MNNYWYVHRHELEEGMIFDSCYGRIKLNRPVPGDGTKWYADYWNSYNDCWTCDDITIEPSDLTILEINNGTS